jgi:DNA-binding transcriptional ArsR family regulator
MSEPELPDWTTEMDREILELLNTELTLTPGVIAENIDRSSGAVTRRLNALEAGDLVKKVDRGKYRITPKALEILEGGFEMITSPEGDKDSTYTIAARDRDEILEEEGRREVDQETYGLFIVGMFQEEVEQREEPIDYEKALRAGIKKAEKYNKVVE